MPVTARLSKAFYDRFGDEIVAELVELFNLLDSTYRSELRELNDINFAKFDAKLEQRIVESEARLERRLAAFMADIQARMVTKDQIGELATKSDLAAFATKSDLAAFPTRSELEALATKDALNAFVEGLATKAQLSELSANLERGQKEQLRFLFGVWSVLGLMILGLYAR